MAWLTLKRKMIYDCAMVKRVIYRFEMTRVGSGSFERIERITFVLSFGQRLIARHCDNRTQLQFLHFPQRHSLRDTFMPYFSPRINGAKKTTRVQKNLPNFPCFPPNVCHLRQIIEQFIIVDSLKLASTTINVMSPEFM